MLGIGLLFFGGGLLIALFAAGAFYIAGWFFIAGLFFSRGLLIALFAVGFICIARRLLLALFAIGFISIARGLLLALFAIGFICIARRLLLALFAIGFISIARWLLLALFAIRFFVSPDVADRPVHRRIVLYRRAAAIILLFFAGLFCIARRLLLALFAAADCFSPGVCFSPAACFHPVVDRRIFHHRPIVSRPAAAGCFSVVRRVEFFVVPPGDVRGFPGWRRRDWRWDRWALGLCRIGCRKIVAYSGPTRARPIFRRICRFAMNRLGWPIAIARATIAANRLANLVSIGRGSRPSRSRCFSRPSRPSCLHYFFPSSRYCRLSRRCRPSRHSCLHHFSRPADSHRPFCPVHFYRQIWIALYLSRQAWIALNFAVDFARLAIGRAGTFRLVVCRFFAPAMRR